MNIFQPVVSTVRAAVLKLSKLDGNPGLSVDDFMVIADWTVNIDQSSLSGAAKATQVTDKVLEVFGVKLPDKWAWVPYVITWAAHFVAKRQGKIK